MANWDKNKNRKSNGTMKGQYGWMDKNIMATIQIYIMRTCLVLVKGRDSKSTGRRKNKGKNKNKRSRGKQKQIEANNGFGEKR
jgi:hypothetical protein